MPDFECMTWLEALRFAKDESGLTSEEIAIRMGVKPSVVRRYLQNTDGYAPGLDKLPDFCSAVENTVILRWLEAQINEYQYDIPPAKSRAEVLTAVARVSAALGDVQRRLADSEVGGLDSNCAREIRSSLADVIGECREVMAMLKTMASHSHNNEAPLASLATHKEPSVDKSGSRDSDTFDANKFLERYTRKHRPWWKFWDREG